MKSIIEGPRAIPAARSDAAPRAAYVAIRKPVRLEWMQKALLLLICGLLAVAAPLVTAAPGREPARHCVGFGSMAGNDDCPASTTRTSLADASTDRSQPKGEDSKRQTSPASGLWSLRVTSRLSAPSGPLPNSTSSEYLETRGSGFVFDSNPTPPVVSHYISLRPKWIRPAKAYLEVQFENPVSPDTPIVVGHTFEKRTIKEASEQIMIRSPHLGALKCKDYEIKVVVYRDASKSDLLGTHIQFSRSTVNTERATSREEVAEALLGQRNSCGETVENGENLIFPVPWAWSLGHRQTSGGVSIEEYVPFGQSVHNWREMITVRRFRGQGHDPVAVLNAMQNWNLRNCPRPLQRPVSGGRADDRPIATTLLVCGEVPGLHVSEVAVMKAVTGNENVFVFHKHWRVPVTEPELVVQSLAKEIDEGFELAQNVRLCDTRDPRLPCQVSRDR